MASIFGALGLPDTDYVYVNTVGQSIVYDVTQNQVLGDHREDMQASMAFLVDRTTSDHKIRYKLPGSGEMQRINRQGRPGAVKAINGWDVGLPLEEFGAEVAGDRVTMAYMSMAAYQLHVQTVMRKDMNTTIKEMLKALFNNTERTFVDELWGSLLVEPLANGDSVTYPPLVGSTDDATAQNYLASGYVSASISDTNNPIPTIVSALEGHFGTPTGGSAIAVFINNAETAKIQGLANFDPVPNRFVTYGDNVSLVQGFEDSPLPGRVLGETDSALIVEWRRIPAGYLLAVHLDAPKPLLRRIDPPQVGLGDGLQLVAEDLDFPFKTADWSHRFGFGVGNRLNGIVMQLTAGSYTIPTLYA
jgi:hypothetical protein